MTTKIPKIALTLDAAVDATGLSRTRLYRAIASGDLKTFSAGRRRMVSAKALEDFVTLLERRSQGKAA